MKQDGLYFILLLVCTLLVDSQAFLGPQHTTERATISGYHRNTSLEYRDVLLLLPRVVVQLFASSASSSSRDADQQAAIFAADKKSSDRDQQTWNDAEIVSSRPACPSGKSTLIEIQVDRETLREYTTPGQFVQLRPHNDDSIDPIFLAISSAPAFGKTSKSTLQFLIKMSPRLPWLPETLVKGTTVKISPVMGSGFPLNQLLSRADADADASTIILAAAGSGIAPLKACIESGLLVQQRQQSNIQAILYYGEWTEEDLCFTDLYDGWKAEHGVDMKRVLSRAPDTQGYIQKVLSDDGLVQNADNAAAKSTWAILCGMDDMVESCTQVLRDAGVDEDRILLNL